MSRPVLPLLLLLLLIGATLAWSGCQRKPKVDASPGRACFKMYKLDAQGARVEPPGSVKVGEEVGVDTTCADPCRHNYDVNWGDGDYGTSQTHKYRAAGTYTIKYECEIKRTSTRTRNHKPTKRNRTSRYMSTQSIVVVQ